MLQPISNDTTFLKTSGRTTKRARLVNIRFKQAFDVPVHSS